MKQLSDKDETPDSVQVYIKKWRETSGCNSTQSAKSASATDSSALRGRNLTATRTLPGTPLSAAPIEAEELRRGAGAEEGILDLKEDDLRLDELAPETGLMDPLTAPFLEEAIAIF